MKPELIVALDVPVADAIPRIVRSLPPDIAIYKIGLELFAAEGPGVIRMLVDCDKQTFLDLKLHDIPRTVARAIQAVARHRVALLTVHAGGGREMLKAAAAAARDCEAPPKLLAVTTLTSLGPSDLPELGIARPLADHTIAIGSLAIEMGIDGLVCSPLEAREFRRRLGPAPLLVTPGIRPTGADVGDQKRIATPASAVQAGANYLVVGRPILDAPDPRTAAQSILDEMRSAKPGATAS